MKAQELLLWLLCGIGGFFLGSILFSDLIPRYFLHVNVCDESDDHNPGASNVFKTCGVSWGMLCLGLDVLKGYLPVWLACRFLDPGNLWFAVILAAPVLGHGFSPLRHFCGGKCIATAFGSLLALIPYSYAVALLAVLYILFSTVLKIRPNRLRSMAAFGLFGVISGIWLSLAGKYAVALGCILISLTAMIKHTRFSEERAQWASR